MWVGPLILRAEGHSLLLISTDAQGSDTDAGVFTWSYDTYGSKTDLPNTIVPSIFMRFRPRHHHYTCMVHIIVLLIISS